MKNPWIGLLSYQDPDKIKSDYRFCGREMAISSLFAMIDNNILVTMYGKTGIGKTSVLNAGVFPLLRSQKYLPISIRLGKYEDNGSTSYAKHIVDEINEEIRSAHGVVKNGIPNRVQNEYAVEHLWEYFHTTRFFIDSDEVSPVIALDQFEEVFMGNRTEVVLLLKQIYALIDDNRDIPNKEGYDDIANFRFVFSIREDDLFFLEDCIDENHLVEMKQNRYRLCPLNNHETHDIIMLGGDFMDKNFEDEITARIANLAKDENGFISTNLLSLVCCQLFVQSNGMITIDILDSFTKKPLESFYRNCMSKVSEKTRSFIETQMVDSDRRKFVSKHDFRKNVSEEDAYILTHGEYKIIQNITAGNTECYELIHDSLAKTIFNLRQEESERKWINKISKRNKWIKAGLYAISFFLLGAMAIIYYQFDDNKKMQELNDSRVHFFAVNLNEDSAVIADNYFWEAHLYVFACKKNITDTLVNMDVNKASYSLTNNLKVDSAQSIRIVLNFKQPLKFQRVDTTLSITHLSTHPSVVIPVRKIIPQSYPYKGMVVLDLEGHPVGLQNAIVILHDKIMRTDENGCFQFNLEDSVTANDVLYIVHKNINVYCENNIVVDGCILDKFFVTAKDSVSSFLLKCERIDSIKPREWNYGTSKYSQNGVLAKYSSGENDRIILNMKINGRDEKGNYKVWGFYYFQDEYAKCQENSNIYYSYHVFSGWMDKKDLTHCREPYKDFQIESYDVAGNLQVIHGHYNKRGQLTGTIYSQGKEIATFGQ